MQHACNTPTSTATAYEVTIHSSSSTNHTVVFTSFGCYSYLYGAEGQAGTSGVSVDNLAVGGAQSVAFGGSVSAQEAFADLIPGGAQAALVMLQTDDAANSVSASTFQTNIQNLISHEEALASAPSVILASPLVHVVNGTYPMAPSTAAQASLCLTDRLACVNIQSRGTTVGSTPVGWETTYNPASGLWDLSGSAWPSGGAGVHPNDQGSIDEAQIIYGDLVSPSSMSVVSGSETVPFSSTPFSANTTVVSQILLTGNVTSFTLPAGVDGQQKTLIFCQDETGNKTVSAHSKVHAFFVICSTANKCNSQTFTYSAVDAAWLSSGTGVINE